MSAAIKITTEKDEATPWLRELRGRVSPHRIAAEVGPRCTRLVQRNFRQLGQNKEGWPTTHFYGRAAEATNWQEGFGFVLIAINQIGIRQRLLGGDIRPENAGALTIPAAAEAAGKTAGEFGKLEMKLLPDPKTGRMRMALVLPQGNVTGVRKGKKGDTTTSQATGLAPLFWLAKGVHQNPDPSVLPSDEDFEAEFDKSVEALLRN